MLETFEDLVVCDLLIDKSDELILVGVCILRHIVCVDKLITSTCIKYLIKVTVCSSRVVVSISGCGETNTEMRLKSFDQGSQQTETTPRQIDFYSHNKYSKSTKANRPFCLFATMCQAVHYPVRTRRRTDPCQHTCMSEYIHVCWRSPTNHKNGCGQTFV